MNLVQFEKRDRKWWVVSVFARAHTHTEKQAHTHTCTNTHTHTHVRAHIHTHGHITSDYTAHANHKPLLVKGTAIILPTKEKRTRAYRMVWYGMVWYGRGLEVCEGVPSAMSERVLTDRHGLVRCACMHCAPGIGRQAGKQTDAETRSRWLYLAKNQSPVTVMPASCRDANS